MSRPPRVAFFPDAYDEANGIARVCHALERYTARRALPLLCVYGGRVTGVRGNGTGVQVELRRGPASFRLEHDLTFDLLFWRHYRRVLEQVQAFRPDVVHITGPSDVGQLGALLGHRLSIPMVGSWHTNLHQYAALRVRKRLGWLPTKARRTVLGGIECAALRATLLFYQIPRILLAPNDELVGLLARRLHKPTYLMSHGVDTDLFAPGKRDRPPGPLQIGFVGRLSAEKQVGLLPRLERAIRSTGLGDAQFVIIGDGAEREWLQAQVPTARFCGILRGDALAAAYANLDLFVFPSESETFGLVVLEAMASGVPVIAMTRGGPGFVVEHGVSGFLAADARAFIEATLTTMRDGALRARLGRAARARALGMSWDAVFDRLYEIYIDLGHGTPSPPSP